MTIAKALKGSGEYSIALVVYVVICFFPQSSLLEIQLATIFVMAVLIYASHFMTYIRKWFDFADIISLIIFLPLCFYIIFNDLAITARIILAIFTMALLAKLSAYILSKFWFFQVDKDILPLTAQKLAVWLFAWVGTASLLVTLVYLFYRSTFLEST